MRRIISFVVMAVLTVAVAYSQVSFTKSMKQTAPDEITITFTGTIQKGWHVYSPKEKNGPTPATFNIDKISGAKPVGGLKANKAAISKYEEMFGANVSYYEGSVTFTQKVKLTGKDYKIEGYLEYGACSDKGCLPPTSVDFKYQGKGPQPKTPQPPLGGEVASSNPSQGGESVNTSNAPDISTNIALDNKTDTAQADTISQLSTPNYQLSTDLWAPVIKEMNAFNNADANDNADNSLLSIFFLGILGGLIALLTPCVWPIIPMTVSFFLKRASKEEEKKQKDSGEDPSALNPQPSTLNAKKKGLQRTSKGIRDAIIYGISIVVIYLVLGLAVTAIFGASALNALSTNAIFNIFFFLMLVVFGASFLGGFEITLPSSWNNAVDKKASSTSGLLSIFLMAFTLVLVSFSCTGPIIGFLLVEMGTSGNIVAPAIGMFGFAVALALPFTLFAIFPTWLKSAPKSGNWMNNVKVVLGFVELAFSLKFLSVADLAYGWHILDREVFLSLWIILFTMLGCYLIGWIRFPHDEDEWDEMGEKVINHRTGVFKFFVAVCSFAFAVYMVPGLWGAPCKAVSAFAPPMTTQDFNLAKSEAVEAKYKDYELGMAAAKQAGKPVMIDFTGFGCVNCRKMEAAVWTDETVKKMINEDYVLIQLYVDDKTPLPETIEVTENGQTRKLRTVGDKWSYFQRTKFGSNTQPFYVLLDNNGKPLNSSCSYDEDIQKYIKFLETGLKNYKK